MSVPVDRARDFVLDLALPDAGPSFDSLEAVRSFAGPDYTVAVFEPEARRLLNRVEPTAMHYEVRVSTV